MNPIAFLFSLVGDRLTMEENEYQTVVEKANESYEGSAIQRFFEKYWWLAILLPVVLPALKTQLDALLDRLMPDVDNDGDGDIADLLLLAAQKLKGNGTQQ